MKKIITILLSCFLCSSLIAAMPKRDASSQGPSKTELKQDPFEEDEIDDTDIFAIPLDDSAIEDEEELEEIRQIEKQKSIPKTNIPQKK